METKIRCLGKMEHHGEFDPEEEQDGINVKGTEESGSEGTEENRSERTEEGSDRNEEKITEEDREVLVQMDVDNHNEELDKEKDTNETEDSDKMNNNEMKNDSLREKQDADKDENAEKEKEKQDDDKDGIDEDEFCNTWFTDSRFEELENKAKEEIKKKKTKRKFDMEITPPSFSLENARNWNLEFPTEEKENKYDIIKMRMRFATKMLTHEINIHREEISKQALEFADRNKENKEREALILEAIRV
nr:ulp1 protease family, C-terminal catalytic domain-containing protein [Tanacetum cinerariifolium]